MPYVRNVYHIDGVTDLAKLVSEAEERARHGGRTLIHRHGAAYPCPKTWPMDAGCRLVTPQQEDES